MDKKIDEVREAFEQWCLRENGKWGKKVIERHDDGRYCVMQTYMDWSAWQAGYSAALSAIDPEAIRPSEDTEKLCHQIYDVLPISPALKLLDDGKLYALIAGHDEAIRREALQSVRKEIEEWRDDITCWDYDEGYLDGTENALKIIDASILSAEPAQDESKEVDHEAEC